MTVFHIAVIKVRMESLKEAIIDRNWEDVEFQYDRLRAINKLERDQNASKG
jgi:hypothetical protein